MSTTTATRTTKVTTDRDAAEVALHEARARVARFSADLDVAHAEEANLSSRLAEGDDTVSTAALVKVRTEIERLSVLLGKARRDMDAAKAAHDRATAAASPILAGAIAALMRRNAMALGLYGVPIVVGEPPKANPDMECPAVYLMQRRPLAHDTLKGLTKGSAVIYIYSKPAEGLAIDRARLFSTLAEIARSEGLGTFTATNGRTYDHDPIRVEASEFTTSDYRAPVPLLSDGEPLATFVQGLSAEVSAAISGWSGMGRRKGVSIGGGWAGVNVPVVRCTADKPTAKGQERSRFGELRRIYAVPFVVYSRDMDRDGLRTVTTAALESLSGRFATGLGRIESVALPGGLPFAGDQGRAIEGTAVITVVSKVNPA